MVPPVCAHSCSDIFVILQVGSWMIVNPLYVCACFSTVIGERDFLCDSLITRLTMETTWRTSTCKHTKIWGQMLQGRTDLISLDRVTTVCCCQIQPYYVRKSWFLYRVQESVNITLCYVTKCTQMPLYQRNRQR